MRGSWSASDSLCSSRNASSSSRTNASAGAAGQQFAYERNAFYDMRYGLDSWPLFNLGGGNLPLNWTNGTAHLVDPDK